VQSNDELTEKIVAALRVQAYFVLAHEIGHRQLRHDREWFNWESQQRSYAREIEADDYAISAMKKLHASAATRAMAGIPDPISTSFLEEPSPLERISDHLGYAVDFLADEIFDNPFPILSSSDTHPAFFGRMRALLQRLKLDAQAAEDMNALDRLRLAEAVALASDTLFSMKPTEIEYSNPFQYAYLTGDSVLVVGNDGAPIAAVSLGELIPGKLHKVSLPLPQREASVRYAWPATRGKTLVLRRNDRLERIENQTGQVSLVRDLNGVLGDNSCVKQFLLPPHPQRYALASHCIKGQQHVTIFSDEGSFRTVPLSELAIAASRAAGDHSVSISDIDIMGFDLTASGHPALVYATKRAVYFTNLSETLEPSASHKLALDLEEIPAPVTVQSAKVWQRTFFADEVGRPFFAYGTPIFRDIGIFDAEVRSDLPIATVDLSPSVDEDQMNAILPFVSTFPVGRGRIIINLGGEGAYLLDFGEKSLLPIRRSGFGTLEQVVANGNGYWIYYRKFGSRILVFRGMDHVEP
jgi:hypothetical protein